MIEFIQQYWLQVFFGFIVSALSVAVKFLYNCVKEEQKERRERAELESAEQKILKEGVLAILHDRLYQLCQEYIVRGNITVQELTNLEHVFKGYSGLGGNGTGEVLYKRCKALTVIPSDIVQGDDTH